MKILPSKEQIIPTLLIALVAIMIYNRVPYVGNLLGNPNKPAA